jgi:hypothetical protein
MTTATNWFVTTWHRVRRTERGEGVISAAIAVLIMAFLGAAMWFAFNGTMNTATSKVNNNVSQLGSNSPAGGSAGVGGTGGLTP